ncbi:AbrB/MazE/SpoVT family DNA-binding domain-containing protein [Caviibacterium pharyngocola]|nr:AbrB/MazE/SpoVT family DNA-binding domain-containing protein [Caviibacterium pharyngocola]
MQLQIKKWGNSAAVRLPQAVLAQLHLSENDHFDLEVQPDGLMLRPVKSKKRYSIQTLMAEMGDDLPRVEGWDEMKSVGKEG